MQITEIIRSNPGWCPDTGTAMSQLPILNDDTADGAPAQRTGMPASTGWLNRYRNRIFLWAVFYSLAFLPFILEFQGINRVMQYSGIVAGLVIFAGSARRIWRSFDQTLGNEQDTKTGLEGYAILFFVVGIILAGVVLLCMAFWTIIPYSGALALPAFATGLAFIPWYVLVLIVVWEWKTGCILVFDKQTHAFTAVRCSGNAFY
ncbi:MAG: DUF1673 family protein [Methanoregula sp.]